MIFQCNHRWFQQKDLTNNCAIASNVIGTDALLFYPVFYLLFCGLTHAHAVMSQLRKIKNRK